MKKIVSEKTIAIKIAKKRYELEKLEIELQYFERKREKETKIGFNL